MEDALRGYMYIYYYSTRLYATALTKSRQKLTVFNAIFRGCKGSDSSSYMKDLFSIRQRANEHSSYTNILPFSQKKSVFLLWVITSTFMFCPIIFMDLSRSVAALSHYIEILCQIQIFFRSRHRCVEPLIILLRWIEH